jgi:type II secretory pathway pseudopilin PulG
LVELLVVITIIIILMGLLTPVIMIALGNAREARIIGDIAGLDTSLKAYKEKYGSYPPSDFSDMIVSGVVNTNSSAARHLAKAFPRCDVTQELLYIQQPWRVNPSLRFFSPADAMVFWLSGFSPDPEHPIKGLLPAPGTTVAAALAMSLPTRSPFFEFAQARVQRQPGWPQVSNSGPTVVQLQNGIWAYCDSSNTWYLTVPVYSPADTPGVPYVYFASQNYVVRDPTTESPKDDGTGHSIAYPYDTTVWQQGGQGVVRPYASDPPAGQFPANGNWPKNQGPQPVNPNSFQIISAGLDGAFGGGGVDDQGKSGLPTLCYFPSGTFYGGGDRDNLTNFSPKNLGDSIPK